MMTLRNRPETLGREALFSRSAVFVWIVSGLLVMTGAAQAKVLMPSVFGNGMVLQRDLAVPVWGWDSPGQVVIVSFAGQTRETTADKTGRWMVRLEPVPASNEGRSLKVQGSSQLAIEDVLVGDVYVCSGQSNMEWTVSGSLNGKQEVSRANHPDLRLFNVPAHETSPVPLPRLKTPGKWAACTPQTIGSFSAVGYYFGRRLQKESGVPIGLIGTNWGGTRIEPWTPPVGFHAVPELRDLAEQVDRSSLTAEAGKKQWDRYFDAMTEWVAQGRRNVAEGRAPGAQPKTPGVKNHQDPTAIYNAMVHPLIPYGIRGVIWYQGESNGGEGESYYHKTRALVEGWRQKWGQTDFPIYFYWTQLADFQSPTDDPAGGDGWAKLREAQRKALAIPNTGMAVIIDIGNAKDIHPRNKQDVGARLANWALRDVYEKDVVPSGPLFRKVAQEGNRLRIHFDHVGSGLMVGKKTGLQPTVEDTGSLQRFAIAGEDKQWHWASAEIDGESVVVSSPEVAQPVAVRYAWSMNPAGANLYNREGMPASPFRSDDW